MGSRGRRLSEVVRVLEVIARWGDEVLCYTTLAPGEVLLAGPTGACDLLLPEAVLPAALPLLRVEADALAVQLPPGARLDMHRPGGEVISQLGDGRTVQVVDGTAELALGELVVLLRWSRPPEAVAAWNPWDWRSHKSTAVSFAGHLAVLLLVAAVPPATYALSSDSFDHAPRFIPGVTRPLEQMPEWLLRQRQAGDGGGAGLPAPGDPGKAGKPDAPKVDRRLAVKGKSDVLQPLGPAAAAELAANTGLLKVLPGSRVAGALLDPSQSALGADAETAMGHLIGDRIGEAYGVGGLALYGTGRGGTCGDPPGSCGFVGGGGGIYRGRIGWNKARRGLVGGLGAYSAGPPRVIAGRLKMRGALSKDLIRRVVRRHINEVRYCYERELTASDRFDGRVVVSFVIQPNGTVGIAQVQQSTLGRERVEQCVTGAVRRWQFPKPEGGGLVQVTYPFVFRAPGT